MDRLLVLNKDMGALEARVTGLERRIDDRLASQAKELENLRHEQKDSNNKLDRLLGLVQQGQGSWKTLGTLSVIAVAAGGVVAWILDRVQFLNI